MKTILEAYVEAFPWKFLYSTDRQPLESMPIDSNCGQDCMKAIRSAKPLLKHNSFAYGAHTNPPARQHPKGYKIREEIADAVLNICICYITG